MKYEDANRYKTLIDVDKIRSLKIFYMELLKRLYDRAYLKM